MELLKKAAVFTFMALMINQKRQQRKRRYSERSTSRDSQNIRHSKVLISDKIHPRKKRVIIKEYEYCSDIDSNMADDTDSVHTVSTNSTTDSGNSTESFDNGNSNQNESLRVDETNELERQSLISNKKQKIRRNRRRKSLNRMKQIIGNNYSSESSPSPVSISKTNLDPPLTNLDEIKCTDITKQ